MKWNVTTAAFVAAILGGTGFLPSAYAKVDVTDVTARQRYPWNGLVDITCTVSGITGNNKYYFAVAAVMPDSDAPRYVSHYWVVQDGTNSVNREVCANGDYRLLWDAGADLGTVVHSNMVVRVLLDSRKRVQLWEGGPYWAELNIGAEKPWEGGYYFWWGASVGYSREAVEQRQDGIWRTGWVPSDGSVQEFLFDADNVPTYNKSPSMLRTEGWITENNVLAPEHDAAQVQWGRGWRMPTKSELGNLCAKCDWTYTMTNTVTGVNMYEAVPGFLISGKGAYKSVSIFLPFYQTGYALGSGRVDFANSNMAAYYWSSSFPTAESNTTKRYFLRSYYDGTPRCSMYDSWNSRSGECGMLIRPVTE
ncbi:MAG: hypothetical protein J5985_09180 [Kiritimatiellae bacterium]|nr:hypothetical protein [Kiritimatiellia bacterium]